MTVVDMSIFNEYDILLQSFRRVLINNTIGVVSVPIIGIFLIIIHAM